MSSKTTVHQQQTSNRSARSEAARFLLPAGQLDAAATSGGACVADLGDQGQALSVRVSPSIFTAVPQPLRVPHTMWLILRAHDQAGTGWYTHKQARDLLTAGQHKLFTRRQYRAMIRRGMGAFWRETEQGIALHGRAAVAAHFGVFLKGAEIRLPVADLTRGHGRARQANADAALLAAYYAGRKSQEAPISRRTIRRVTGISRSTQKRHEQRVGIRARRNFEHVAPFSEYALQQARYIQRLPAFKFTDHRRMGGGDVKAWVSVSMPNTYFTPRRFERIKSRRQRAINQFLRNLCITGDAEQTRSQIERWYHEDAEKAAMVYGRASDTPNYCPISGAKTANAAMWRSLVRYEARPWEA